MKIRYILITPLVLTILVVGLISTIVQPPVAAQDDTKAKPDPVERYNEPAYVEGGEAEWTLNDVTFVSNYPDGFTFSGKATSSAGTLSSVSIYFSHNPLWKDDTRQRGEVDPTTGEMTVVVEGRNADDIPPWVEVNFRWRISDSAGTIYWSDWFLGEEYADNTSNWERFESEDVLIFIQEGFPRRAVDLSFEAMASARPIYEAAFGRVLSYKPRMILFADEASFRAWRSFEYASGTISVGVTNQAWGAFAQYLYSNDMYDLAYSIVVHEIAHLYQYDLYERRAPSWWIEGNATYFEQYQSYDYEGRVRNLAALDLLPRLFDGTGGPITAAAGPDGIGRLGYDVGYTFNKWLIDTYGMETHLAIITRLGEPNNLPVYQWEDNFNNALVDILGMPLEEIEGEWRAWLGASAFVPTLIPTPTLAMRFPPTPTPFGQ